MEYLRLGEGGGSPRYRPDRSGIFKLAGTPENGPPRPGEIIGISRCVFHIMRRNCWRSGIVEYTFFQLPSVIRPVGGFPPPDHQRPVPISGPGRPIISDPLFRCAR